jgi:hypothetical protein
MNGHTAAGSVPQVAACKKNAHPAGHSSSRESGMNAEKETVYG